MQRVEKMFDTHPAPASDAGEEAFAMVRATAECALVCTVCADACLGEPDPSSLRDCIRRNQDCADICQVTSRLISRPGPQDADTLRAQLKACVTACRSCADECERHADGMEHCRICAETCRKCADACERMVAALIPA